MASFFSMPDMCTGATGFWGQLCKEMEDSASVGLLLKLWTDILIWTIIGGFVAYHASYAGSMKALEDRTSLRRNVGAPQWRPSVYSWVLPRRLDIISWNLIPITDFLVPGCAALSALVASLAIFAGAPIGLSCGLFNAVAFCVCFTLAYR
eukprot:2040845-Rhodomonas_salina.5